MDPMDKVADRLDAWITLMGPEHLSVCFFASSLCTGALKVPILAQEGAPEELRFDLTAFRTKLILVPPRRASLMPSYTSLNMDGFSTILIEAHRCGSKTVNWELASQLWYELLHVHKDAGEHYRVDAEGRGWLLDIMAAGLLAARKEAKAPGAGRTLWLQGAGALPLSSYQDWVKNPEKELKQFQHPGMWQ